MNWKIIKNLSRIATYIFIILAVVQILLIMQGYVGRHWGEEDFWKLKEEYKWNVIGNQKPAEVSRIESQFDILRYYEMLIIIGACMFEFSKYKQNPEVYKDKMKKNWLGRIYLKVYEVFKKGVEKDGEIQS